jgi:hypothetical protein
MNLGSGLGGGFALAAWPGTAGTNANASPQGPLTAAEAGFGVTAGGGGRMSGTTTGVLSVGTLALAALVWVWYSLPR